VSERFVYLSMPAYGRQTGDAGRGFWRAMRDQSSLTFDYKNGSLLTSSFNQTWAGALNRVRSGARVDYFAMLHDDVGPEDFWLDTLIDELEAKQLDVLGVVVPIKDTRGLTSLAIASDDPFMPKYRFTMTDVYQLPETFSSADLDGEVLLLNTGCWVCKFDVAWASKVWFETHDRIVFNKARDRYETQTEPEDWFFSRELSAHGLKLGATRKIKLIHTGDVQFSNQLPWGSELFDSEASKKSLVAGAFPYDVAGWLTTLEGAKLNELARGKRVVEIGSYCGLSTICMARSAKTVTAVDYFDGRATPQPRDTFDDFVDALARHEVIEKVSIASPDDDLVGPFDLAFIDGAHDRASVDRDIDKIVKTLSVDAIVVFHDYASRVDPEVKQAVDAWVECGAELLEVYQTLAIVKPPARVLTEV
jgi:hypothetical protein